MDYVNIILLLHYIITCVCQDFWKFLKDTIMMKYIQRSGLLRLGFINQRHGRHGDEISSITLLLQIFESLDPTHDI